MEKYTKATQYPDQTTWFANMGRRLFLRSSQETSEKEENATDLLQRNALPSAWDSIEPYMRAPTIYYETGPDEQPRKMVQVKQSFLVLWMRSSVDEQQEEFLGNNKILQLHFTFDYPANTNRMDDAAISQCGKCHMDAYSFDTCAREWTRVEPSANAWMKQAATKCWQELCRAPPTFPYCNSGDTKSRLMSSMDKYCRGALGAKRGKTWWQH
ncbi:expressed unknown protein [Seminavis robusta]|uniref:Uncharacterized protein n=1 Tax=Seminavis robusta TaxID=568900 RepID=A0A9N8HH69_9STRA|nr:expressed unknown protein [Seminavis robusta]|eukprot:Sro687_g187190.1 n/a (212) ;mRNA; f:6050-6685